MKIKLPSLVLASFFTLIAGCMEKPPVVEQAKVPAEIRVYSQKDFCDVTLLKEYEKKTGLKIIVEDYESRDAALAVLQENPGEYDLIIAEEQTANLFASLKLVEKKLPGDTSENTGAAKPYLQGFDGLAYNTKFVTAEVAGWEVLFDETYLGKVALIDHPRETVGAILKYSELMINTSGSDDLIVAELNAGMLYDNKVIYGEPHTNLDKLMSGDVWVAQVRSGDFAQRGAGNNDVKFVFPQEGFGIFRVSLAVGKDSPNPKGAAGLIEFLLKPKNAFRASTALGYGSLVKGAKQDASNKLANPSPAILKLGEQYSDMKEVANVHEKIFSLAKKTSPSEDEEESTEDDLESETVEDVDGELEAGDDEEVTDED